MTVSLLVPLTQHYPVKQRCYGYKSYAKNLTQPPRTQRKPAITQIHPSPSQAYAAIRGFRKHEFLETGGIYNKQNEAHDARRSSAYTRHYCKLVNQLHASNRALVTRTGQLVAMQPEMCECSQLAELGWDATCEASRQMSHCE